jgi:hypothetical protein
MCARDCLSLPSSGVSQLTTPAYGEEAGRNPYPTF